MNRIFAFSSKKNQAIAKEQQLILIPQRTRNSFRAPIDPFMDAFKSKNNWRILN